MARMSAIRIRLADARRDRHGDGVARRRGRHLDDPGPRLRPRGRPVAVGRVRLRQARHRLQADPPPLLHGHEDRQRRAGACACCSAPARERSASTARAARAAGGWRPAATTASPSSGGGSCCATRAASGSRGAGGRARPSSGVTIDGFGRYRGSLIAHAAGGNMLVINAVGIEGYVKGVVPNEVPSTWPADALRAQAVVARTYGLATDRRGPFDQYDDTRSQVYGGKRSETKADQPRRVRDREAGRHLQRPARDHVLLLDLGRADRELGVRLRRRQSRAPT